MDAHPDKPLERGEYRWRWLSNGLEGVWRSKSDGIISAVVLFLLFAILFAFYFTVALAILIDDDPIGAAVLVLLLYAILLGVLAFLSGRLLIRNIRGRGQSSRLLATRDGGIQKWSHLNLPPHIDMSRDVIEDVMAEGDQLSFPGRRWQVVIISRNRSRHVLYKSVDRDSMVRLCRTLKQAIQLH